MTIYYIHELEENIKQLKSGKGVVRIESGMPDEHIGKIIRKKLELADGAPIRVEYEVIPDDCYGEG